MLGSIACLEYRVFNKGQPGFLGFRDVKFGLRNIRVFLDIVCGGGTND